MIPSISIVICTYNPRMDYFKLCLNGIIQASQILKPLEILIIDNNSQNEFELEEYVQNFIIASGARLIKESQQGLTPARLRGIKEAKGNLLLFIDDDNIINENYFSEGILISEENPKIGAWSGVVNLIFEKEPEQWTEKYWGMLVYRNFEKEIWSNLPHLAETMPSGAGMFVRKSVAEHYYRLHYDGFRKFQLDRAGNALLSGGDNDLAACSCDLNLGVGLFSKLKLDHVIPKERLTLSYLLRLTEGIAMSSLILKSFRGEYPKQLTWKNQIANKLRYLTKKGHEKAFFSAVLRGEARALKIISKSK